MSGKYPSKWYVQHSRDVVKVIGEQEVSHLKHRTLVLERYRRPDLLVVFNERLQYRLATQVQGDEYLIIKSRKESKHESPSKRQLKLRERGAVREDEEPA